MSHLSAHMCSTRATNLNPPHSTACRYYRRQRFAQLTPWIIGDNASHDHGDDVWGESCVDGDGFGVDEYAYDERCRRGFQGPIQMADGRRFWTCRRFPPALLMPCDHVKLTRLQVLFMMIVLLTEMQTPMISLHSILAISLLSPPPNSAATAHSLATTRRCSPAATKSPSSSNLQVSLEPTGCRYLAPTSRLCPSPPRRHAHHADARLLPPSSHSAPAATSRCRSRSQDDQGRWRAAALCCDCSLWYTRVHICLCVSNR